MGKKSDCISPALALPLSQYTSINQEKTLNSWFFLGRERDKSNVHPTFSFWEDCLKKLVTMSPESALKGKWHTLDARGPQRTKGSSAAYCGAREAAVPQTPDEQEMTSS